MEYKDWLLQLNPVLLPKVEDLYTVEMNLQTMEWGARWYGSYIPSFTQSILR